jgi:hypothetical protein
LDPVTRAESNATIQSLTVVAESGRFETMKLRIYDIAIGACVVAIVGLLAWPNIGVRQTSDQVSPPDSGAAETAVQNQHPATVTPAQVPKSAPTPKPQVSRVLAPEAASHDRATVSAPVVSDTKPRVRSDCSPSATQLRKLAADIFAKHQDPTAFARALDVAVGVDPNASVPQRGAVVSYSDELTVLALFPYDTFRLSLLEALRKKEPIGQGEVPLGVRVVVSPSRIGAPDIDKIVVERDGQPVSPIASSLRPKEMVTRLGARERIHAGEVMFPCSAFAPGAVVVVTAIPAIGSNLVKVMQPEELRTLK